MERGEEPWAGRFHAYYDLVDRSVGALVDRLPDDCTLVLLSDHGFCRLDQEVYVNRWLERDGWLQLQEPARSIASIVPAGSRAYCMDPGRLYLNLEGSEPGGIVPASEYHAVRDELRAWAEGLPFVTARWPCARRPSPARISDRGPDLVLVSHDGSDLKGAMANPELTGKGPLTGMHTRDNAFRAGARQSPRGRRRRSGRGGNGAGRARARPRWRRRPGAPAPAKITSRISLMPLALVLGPANCGKIGFLQERFLAFVDAGSDPFLIVPNRPDVEAFEHDVLRRRGALLGGRVGTFDTLFDDVLERCGDHTNDARRRAAAADLPAPGGLRRTRSGGRLGPLLGLCRCAGRDGGRTRGGHDRPHRKAAGSEG